METRVCENSVGVQFQPSLSPYHGTQIGHQSLLPPPSSPSSFAAHDTRACNSELHFILLVFLFFSLLPTSAERPQRCIPRNCFFPAGLMVMEKIRDSSRQIKGVGRGGGAYAKQRVREGLLLQSVELCAKARVIKKQQTSHSTNSAKLCTCIRPGGRNKGKCFETGNEINYLGLPSNFPFASYRHHSGLFLCVCE